MRALVLAFAMYSRIPVPRTQWDASTRADALCWFPLVGAAVGAVLWGWMALARLLALEPVLFAAGAAALPVLLSGGIHLDGFCDTCDALASGAERERMLEILKDSHVGAFAVFGCGLYLLVLFAAWCQADWSGRAGLALALGPVLSRSLSGLFAAALPNARPGGLLAAFTDPMDRRRSIRALALWTGAASLAMAAADPWTGCGALVGAAAACGYYLAMVRRRFGGVTGDLEGFFLQLCELSMVLCGALSQALAARI